MGRVVCQFLISMAVWSQLGVQVEEVRERLHSMTKQYSMEDCDDSDFDSD